jgi:hypothetical protein
MDVYDLDYVNDVQDTKTLRAGPFGRPEARPLQTVCTFGNLGARGTQPSAALFVPHFANDRRHCASGVQLGLVEDSDLFDPAPLSFWQRGHLMGCYVRWFYIQSVRAFL